MQCQLWFRAFDRGPHAPDVLVTIVGPAGALRVQEDRVRARRRVRLDDLAREPIHERRLVGDRLLLASRGQRAAVRPARERRGVDKRRAATVRGTEVREERVRNERGLVERNEVRVRRRQQRLQRRRGHIRGLACVPRGSEAQLRAGDVEEALELRDERVERRIGGARGRRVRGEARGEVVEREDDLLRELREL